MNRQKPIKTLVVSSNLGVLLMALIRLYLSKLNAVASNPIRSGARTTWRYQQVKYQPSAKKMVKPKQVITFVLLLERSDGFLLCGVDAHRAEDRASGFYLGACSQGKFRGLSSECSSEHYSPQSVFLFFVSYPFLPPLSFFLRDAMTASYSAAIFFILSS